MLVGRGDIEKLSEALMNQECLSLDTETTGLRPHHGDRMFALILGTGTTQYYFNFQPYEDADALSKDELEPLRKVFLNKSIKWYMHNAKFDLEMLRQDGFEILGPIHDTMVVERLLRNDQISYSLAATAKRWGHEKDERVEAYIKDNKLWSWVDIPGRGGRKKDKHFFKVPLSVIQPYAETDSSITYSIAKAQEARIEEIDSDRHHKDYAPIPLSRCRDVEQRLLPAVHKMEARGVRINKDYCEAAIRFQDQRLLDQMGNFKTQTGRDYKASPLLFKDVFKTDEKNWKTTEKGNPSFESTSLEGFENPAARTVLSIRDAKSKRDFFSGFIYHADRDDVIHPSFNQAGTVTGRFSSSEPNFQNLTSEEAANDQFPIRRALIPREGYCFIMPDYSQMEYRLMLEYAGVIYGEETSLIKEIKNGKDIHQATADLVRERSGFDLGRSRAKNANFATLYGSGLGTLARTLGAGVAEARLVKESILEAAPEIRALINFITKAASMRGFIFDWLGRRFQFPDREWTYKAPNALIQGGCASIVKVAMVGIDEYLTHCKSKMIMTVHDELVIEVHKSEIDTVPAQVVRLMESSYQAKYVPMLVSMEHSWTSLGDKLDGYPK